MNGGIEVENDKLVQMWAVRQRSYVSGKPAQCGHHIHTRHHKLLRWDLKNILPLTLQEHIKLHEGKLSYQINPCRQEYLDRMVVEDYKTYLLRNNLTDKEFVILCNKKLKEALSAEDTENV